VLKFARVQKKFFSFLKSMNSALIIVTHHPNQANLGIEFNYI
jgi:hypothetical protein